MAWPVFFTRDAMTNEEAVKTGHRDVQTYLDQARTQFLERDVLARFPRSNDIRSSLLNPA
jgi:hypothetical protein